MVCSGTVSLTGLLAYNDDDDRDEPTFELSLFAEGFNELLSRDFGERILQALYAERCVNRSLIVRHSLPTLATSWSGSLVRGVACKLAKRQHALI